MHLVVVDFVITYTGAPRSTVELATRLAEHVKVSFLDPYGACPDFTEAIQKVNVDHHILDPDVRKITIGGRGWQRGFRVARAMPGLLRTRCRVAKKILEIGGDVILVNNPKGLAMTSSRHLRQIPVVAYMRGWYTPDMIPPYAKWMYRRRCSKYFAVSQPTKAALLCSGFDPKKIEVVHNPINVDDMLRRASQPLASPLSRIDRPVRIVLPANILPSKGQHTAVQAMKHILHAGHDAVLWIVGSVPPGNDDSYLTATKKLSADLGVADRVVWLGHRSDVPAIMQAATIVVLPTWTEGLPRVVMEAMSLGRPIAAPPVGGVLDLILPGVTGLNFNVEDDAGLAECVHRFVTEPEQTARMCQAAQDYMRQNFTSAQQTKQILTILDNLIGAS